MSPSGWVVELVSGTSLVPGISEPGVLGLSSWTVPEASEGITWSTEGKRVVGLLAVVTTVLSVGFSSGEPNKGVSSFTATTGSSVTTRLVAGGVVTFFSVRLSIPGNSFSLKTPGVASNEELVGSVAVLQVRDWSGRGPAKPKISPDSLETCWWYLQDAGLKEEAQPAQPISVVTAIHFSNFPFSA